MKKLAALLLLGTISHVATATELPPAPRPTLDKVAFQVTARQWVSTKTALVKVNINATLNQSDLVKARADIMSHLGKIASGEWHITQFDRSQDSSGLDKLYVEAQTRVPQASLTNIYQNAKSVSKPGATYKVSAVDFKPGLEEIQKVKAQLREQLYQLVNAEIARLNKVYTEQHYTVNRLVVTDGNAQPVQPAAYKAREMNTMMLAASPAPALTVSNELIMTAVAEAASNRQESGVAANASQ
ncbi:hypothetical protein [Legionella spiritensis]|uniref:DUF541 domain-containing protein n=1 Tax=Legionella spiritensis TaxID=452 RepID=A0A0W0YYZ5_LEGSP|nr:hypothetical protein [Legionella spiritensis]KTD62056.1 hypothetical protein Lspi_1906 [Legionella spiritensis]SNV34461.1 Uncharacterised protein [Legionella spiritensis]